MRLFAIGAGLVVGAALLATPVSAKEGVVARVLTPIARDAEPGSRVRIVWTLTFLHEGERHPFGGGEIFVRLVGPDGSKSRRLPAEPTLPGRFRATVRVPRGGVARVGFGIMGTACSAEGCRSAPKHFPIVGRVFR
jgi:hypothetical protein